LFTTKGLGTNGNFGLAQEGITSWLWRRSLQQKYKMYKSIKEPESWEEAMELALWLKARRNSRGMGSRTFALIRGAMCENNIPDANCLLNLNFITSNGGKPGKDNNSKNLQYNSRFY
jgi:hypothetical protein